MANYEPFLINPPKRLSRFRKKFRRNDADMGTESAAPWEMGLGIRKGHSKMKVRKTKKKEKLRKRAKKAWRTRRKHEEEAKVATRRKKKAGAKKVSKRKGGRLKKGSLAAKRFMAKLRRMRKSSKTKTVRRRVKTVRHKTVRRRKSTVAKRRTTRVSYKRRGFAKRHKRKLVSAYRFGGAWRTSPFARRPIKPGIRINPFGEELMVVGANPRRRKRRKYSRNPKRRGGYMARRRHRSGGKRKRFKSNPMGSLKSLLPMALAGTGGALAAKMVPRMLGMTTAWSVYGTQAAVVVGGGYALDKYVGKNVADGWIIGSAAYVLSNVLATFVGGALAGLGLDGMGAFPEQYGAFPEQMGMLGNDAMGEYADDAYSFEPGMVY